jgi:hypothetical protein
VVLDDSELYGDSGSGKPLALPQLRRLAKWLKQRLFAIVWTDATNDEATYLRSRLP